MSAHSGNAPMNKVHKLRLIDFGQIRNCTKLVSSEKGGLLMTIITQYKAKLLARRAEMIARSKEL
jgi:hypothetical protein